MRNLWAAVLCVCVSLCVCVRVCVPVCLCVGVLFHTCVAGIWTQNLMSGDFLNCSQPHFLVQDLSYNLDLSVLARLSGH